MKMQKYTSYLMMTVLLTNSLLGVFTASADSLSTVRAGVNQIQADDPLLPSGVTEQKGIFGTIIANVFDTAGKIKVEFLGNLVPGLSTNYISRWNGTNFINSAISDNGTTVVSSRPVQVNSNLRVNGTNSFYLQGNRLYGDNSSALYYYSNNTNASQLLFKDLNNVDYGRVYGNGTGANFGLLDGDGDWSYLAAKDSYTQLRINNSTVFQAEPNNLYISAFQQMIGWNRTGNRYAYTDYVGDDTYPYGLRVLRGNGGANTLSELSHRGTGDFIMRAVDAGTLKFRTNDVDRMIIAPTSGNIGIAQSPSASDRLAVTGNVYVAGDVKASRICNAAGTVCTTLPLSSNMINGGGSANMVARFSDADTLSTGVIQDNGTNVGIGVAPSASDKLYVAGNIKSTGDVIYGNGESKTLSRDDAGLQGSAGAKSGFFETSAPVNYPTGASGWWHMIDVRHSNPTNNFALQIAGSFFDQNLYFRKTNNSATTGWNKIVAENSAGNVGIGTNSPGEKLEITGNQYINGYLRFPHAYGDSNDGKIGNSMFAQGLNIVGINNDNTYRKIQLWGEVTQHQNDGRNTWAGINYFVGNVGIGVTSPAYKLDVFGDINMSGNVGIGTGTPRIDMGVNLNTDITNATGYGLYSNVTSVGPFTANRNYYGTYNVVTNSADNSTFTSTAIGSYNYSLNTSALGSGTKNLYGSYNYARNNVAGSTVTNAYGGYFTVTNSAGSITNGYGVYIGNVDGAAATTYGLYQSDVAGKNYFAGSVGIGNNSPTQKLDITGNAKVSAKVMAAQYCDTAGANCFTTASAGVPTITSGAFTTTTAANLGSTFTYAEVYFNNNGSDAGAGSAVIFKSGTIYRFSEVGSRGMRVNIPITTTYECGGLDAYFCVRLVNTDEVEIIGTTYLGQGMFVKYTY